MVVRPPFLFGTLTTTEEGSEGNYVAYGLVVLAAVFQSGAIVCTRALKPVDVFVISSWIGSHKIFAAIYSLTYQLCAAMLMPCI